MELSLHGKLIVYFIMIIQTNPQKSRPKIQIKSVLSTEIIPQLILLGL